MSAPAMHEAGRGRWLGLATLSLGVSMIIVDATIVNVAVPSIIRDLKLDSTTAEWINTTYALVFAALLVTLGRLGDVSGRRRMYLLGLLVFIGASVLAGAAQNGEQLIAARILQGVGGAMILPSTQSILNANFRGRDRAIAFGIWGSVIGGMAALGPLLGGWLTTYFSWRWAFFINIPVGLVAIAGTLAYIGESKDEDARPGFDLPGFLLITFGLGAFVFGLIEGRNYGWWTPDNRPRARARRARRLLPGRAPSGRAGTLLPLRLHPLALPRVPLREPGRLDRRPGRVRAALRPAAVPPGGARL
ncbi:MAG: drug resistance transporter, EmrB/QacA subfamily, partial [Chloroflexi bacterium]|nr:drug resistance transporter, EmrB/QacA subfamily [Chloroflexota bacterium]